MAPNATSSPVERTANCRETVEIVNELGNHRFVPNGGRNFSKIFYRSVFYVAFTVLARLRGSTSRRSPSKPRRHHIYDQRNKNCPSLSPLTAWTVLESQRTLARVPTVSLSLFKCEFPFCRVTNDKVRWTRAGGSSERIDRMIGFDDQFCELICVRDRPRMYGKRCLKVKSSGSLSYCSLFLRRNYTEKKKKRGAVLYSSGSHRSPLFPYH